jgi:hypothetical protein
MLIEGQARAYEFYFHMNSSRSPAKYRKALSLSTRLSYTLMDSRRLFVYEFCEQLMTGRVAVPWSILHPDGREEADRLYK